MTDWRIATTGDAQALATIGARTFVDTFGHLYKPEDLSAFLKVHTPESWMTELTDSRFVIRIGSIDGADIAYAKLGPPSLPFKPEGPSIELRQFYVLAPHHGTGIAREMMDWVIATARERGAGELYLSVFEDNHRARRFYARYGFEYVADYHFMVGSHADTDHILRLKL